MKKLFLLVYSLGLTLFADAHHIIGGEMYYEYVGPGANQTQIYKITMKLYRGCEPVDNQHSSLDQMINLTIYDNGTMGLYNQPVQVPLDHIQQVSAQSHDPCIISPPPVCYEIGFYFLTIALPVNDAGYTVVFQRCCRNNLLTNVDANTTDVGATYYTVIPGKKVGVIGDNSPQFKKEEAILICAGSRFTYDYSAVDPDGDSLTYSFSDAYTGGTGRNAAPVISAPPPYTSLTYIPPYTYESPMGAGVKIDSITGVISGIAPPAGTYVVAVNATEYRNGVVIGQHRKEFHIDVTDCNRLVVAALPPKFVRCDGLTINFLDNSTPNRSYLWDFGDGTGSTSYSPTHIYASPGVYQVKLQVDPTSNCGDSATSVVRAFPILKPQFTHLGNCFTKPVSFTDQSTNTIGNINSWHWDFGDTSQPGDTSNVQNPTYHFPGAQTYPVILTVGTTMGCLSSDTQQLILYAQPPLQVSPDTDICIRDPMTLQASSSVTGTFTWSPAYNITGASTSSPTVFPKVDTTYQVVFSDQGGCSVEDSVHLRVKSTLTVEAGSDTTLCLGDPISLMATSDGKYGYSWYDASSHFLGNGPGLTITPSSTTFFKVVAQLESCQSSDSVQIRTVAPPQVRLNQDTAICYGDQIPLLATGGSQYQWSPSSGLDNSRVPNPNARPLQTTRYVVAVSDTLGCPRVIQDSVLLTVIPPVQAFAGNDTIITTGDVFALHATGGSQYTWTPAQGLSNPFLPDPLVTGDQDIRYNLLVQTPQGCKGYSSIKIRYIKGPDIYVPNAFTPNGDGMNDVFRPIPVGIRQIYYFRVYNRWGQLVYQTTGYLRGWDGNYLGKKADAGAYVWMVAGMDEQGKIIVKKGTVLLIR
ncbi:MAG: PKD domain-containing protein [Chitinophagaceae bacterium]